MGMIPPLSFFFHVEELHLQIPKSEIMKNHQLRDKDNEVIPDMVSLFGGGGQREIVCLRPKNREETRAVNGIANIIPTEAARPEISSVAT